MTFHLFPTINATLNGAAAILLFMGWRAIVRGDRNMHKKWMLSAFACSAVFLVCYLTYHFSGAGITRYGHTGLLKTIYLSILFTHTVLATIVPVASILALRHALKENFPKHVRITRWLLPMWLYVSITGVVIYVMLYWF